MSKHKQVVDLRTDVKRELFWLRSKVVGYLITISRSMLEKAKKKN